MLKYKMPSWFYGDKRVDYGIRKVSICPQTPARDMQRQPFHYHDSSMYEAMGDINYIAESIVSDLTIAQYVDDVKPAPQ